MNGSNNLQRIGIYAGFLYQPVFIVMISISIAIHPWFNFRTDALSDLGAIGVTNPWLFSVGVIASGVLGVLFSMALLWHLELPFKVFAPVLAISSALFILVGIFPDNAPIYVYPNLTVHKFLATTGFILGSITVLAFSIFWLRLKKWRALGLFILVLSFIPTLGYIYGGPGIAIFEICFSFVVLIWSYSTIYYYRARDEYSCKK